ncbi:low temperature requirement protein A [Micromonospora sp. NPDC048999]|uniref:low temperature requirement protein A n=1 Tax=Micromonospora sp. NPDC048999 TaxID=3155391 RepID=UPI0033DDBCC6
MRGAATELPGSREPPSRAGFVELLFDVVLVFAFTRLSDRLVEQLNWCGFYSAMVLTLALWWLWYRMAWTANRYDPTRPMIQVMVIVRHRVLPGPAYVGDVASYAHLLMVVGVAVSAVGDRLIISHPFGATVLSRSRSLSAARPCSWSAEGCSTTPASAGSRGRGRAGCWRSRS